MKKKLLYIAAIVICLSIMASETFAYYTRKDTARNVITSGGVAIGTGDADAFSGATGTESAETETYVDAMTGATVTSKAVARCVNAAVGYVTGADAESGATSWGG